MPTRFRFASRRIAAWVAVSVLFASFLITLTAATSFCAPVDMVTARVVAENAIRDHIERFGSWNESPFAQVADGQEIKYEGIAVAYNFTVIPSGHVLVAHDNLLSPIQLYSTRSNFDPDLENQPNAIESWIIPEQQRKTLNLQQRSRAISLKTTETTINTRISGAWDFYIDASLTRGTRSAATDLNSKAITRAAVGPLLTSQWAQDDPYNLMTPIDDPSDGDCPTLTGCVANAWAQLLKYWNWPISGRGSRSYEWINSQGTTTIQAVNFASRTYDWDLMPDILTSGSDEQKSMTAQLIYDVAVAAETDFGCSISSSSIWANDVLDVYFKYKAMEIWARTDPSTGLPNFDSQRWFELFKTELTQTPPRPLIFSIFSGIGGHEVIVDGYREDPTYQVHINFGWPNKNYDGYYDVTDDTDFITGPYDWDPLEQYVVTGIEPNYEETWPVVNAGSDQNADEYDTITLYGDADDTATTYQWRCIDMPELTIANEATTTVHLPSVSSDTQLVFRLKAIDSQGGVGYDDVTITVRDTGDSDSGGGSSSSSSGGGCFIGTLLTYPDPPAHM